MDIQDFLKKIKELYPAVLNFFDSESNSDDEFQVLTKIIDGQEISKNRSLFLQLL